VLERDVQVVTDTGVTGHHLNQPRGDVARVRVHQSQPAQIANAGQYSLEQIRQRVWLTHIAAVIRGILGRSG